MLQALLNIFKIPELRTKVLFTLGLLAVYRIGFWIPLPGISQASIDEYFRNAGQSSGAGRIADFMSVFSGGALSQSTIFGLGIMPYISASIIFQLIGTVSTRFKKLQEEGPTGRQKIAEWTRYATIGLCIIQAVGWLKYITHLGLVYPEQAASPAWWIMAVSALTAGTVFLMWLGEQIDKYGIGNGVSMIIMAGILSRMPNAVMDVYKNFDPSDDSKIGIPGLLAIVGGFALVVGGSVLMTVAQRRIPVQQAKHTRGRKVFGGQKSYLPLRVNHSGVMPIVFASSLMIFPSTLFSMLRDSFSSQAVESGASSGFWHSMTTMFSWLSDNFAMGEFPYIFFEVLLIYFFAYFWITVQFNPQEMAKQLREHGSFIPGLRPGPRTEEYLGTVMSRITFVGAAFLAIVSVLPTVAGRALNVDYGITQFLGGTGLLIVVSVILDFIQRVEANLLMRNYAGFLGGNADGKGPRIQSARAAF